MKKLTDNSCQNEAKETILILVESLFNVNNNL